MRADAAAPYRVAAVNHDATTRARSLHALAFSVAAACALCPSVSDAQERAPQRFFLRIALGGGYGFNDTDVSDPSFPAPVNLAYSGGGVLGALSLGAFVTSGLALHVDASACALLDPAVSLQGMRVGLPGTSDFTTSTSMVGAGFTWIHRTNVWVSASLGVTQVSVELPFERAAGHALTALGVAGQVMVGRDWRVAEGWYVGGAVQGILAYVPESPFGEMALPSVWRSGGVGASLTVSVR